MRHNKLQAFAFSTRAAAEGFMAAALAMGRRNRSEVAVCLARRGRRWVVMVAVRS